MFKSIQIKNLRAITDLRIDNLEQVNGFVGQNNCGKTTVLEALFFLIGANNPQLPVRANTFRRLAYVNKEWWATFFHNMDLHSSIQILGELHTSAESEKLVILPRVPAPTTTQLPNADRAPDHIQNSDSQLESTLDGLQFEYTGPDSANDGPAISAIYQKGEQLVTEGKWDRSIKGIFVAPSTIYDWKNRFSSAQRNKQVPELISTLQQIEPNIADIRLNEIGVLEADIGLPKLIPLNLMGGGIAKFVAVALAMLDMKDGIVLIDELENGLSYSSQKKIWKAIFAWATKLNVQVFATTHSNECIKAFCSSSQPALFGAGAKLYRIEREKEKFKAVEYTTPALEESLKSNWEVR